jgi:hypothetical protein
VVRSERSGSGAGYETDEGAPDVTVPIHVFGGRVISVVLRAFVIMLFRL